MDTATEQTPVRDYEKLDVLAYYTVQYFDVHNDLVATRHYTATEVRLLRRVLDVLQEHDTKWSWYVGKDLRRADIYRAWASPTNPAEHMITLVAPTEQTL